MFIHSERTSNIRKSTVRKSTQKLLVTVPNIAFLMSQQSSFSSSSSVNLTSINPLHYIFEIRFSSSIVWLATKPLDDEIAPKSPVSVTRLPAAAPPLKGLQAGGWTPPQRSSKNRMRLAPSKARRLRSEVIWLQSPKDIQRWFLKKKSFLEEPAITFITFHMQRSAVVQVSHWTSKSMERSVVEKCLSNGMWVIYTSHMGDGHFFCWTSLVLKTLLFF